LYWNLNAPIHKMPLESRPGQEVFHLINSRFLADGINTDRWPPLVRECLHLLLPGGWLQMVEPLWVFQSGSQDLPCLREWRLNYAKAQERMGKNPRVGPRLSGYMVQAKFQDITSKAIKVPAAGWKVGRFGTAHMPFVYGIRSLLSHRLEEPRTGAFQADNQDVADSFTPPVQKSSRDE